MNNQKPANDSNTTRIAVLETTVAHIHETMERIEKKMDQGFARLDAKVDDHFKWVMGTIIISLIIPIFLKVFHVN